MGYPEAQYAVDELTPFLEETRDAVEKTSAETKDVSEQILANFLKPVKYHVDNTDNYEIGQFFDVYLEKPLSDNMILFDDGYLVGHDEYMRSTDLFRVLKNDDGTTTARFLSSQCFIDYKLNDYMMPISYERITSIPGVTYAPYINDAYWDEETATEYFLGSDSTENYNNKDFWIVKHGPSGAIRYDGTLPNVFYNRYKVGGSSAGTFIHDGANGCKLRPVSENKLVMCHGNAVYLIELNDSNSSAVVLNTLLLESAYGYARSKNPILYVNKRTNSIYVILGTNSTYSTCFYILSYDTTTNSLLKKKEAVLHTYSKGSYGPVPIPLDPKVIEIDDDIWTIPIMVQSYSSGSPIFMFLKVDTNTEEFVLSGLFNLPEPIHQYDIICPIALTNSSVVYTYRSRYIPNDDGTKNVGSVVSLVYINEAGVRIRDICNMSDVDQTVSLTVVDGQPMYFIGYPYTISGSSRYVGTGKCVYLLKGPAFKLGVIVDKNKDDNTITVARSGNVRVNRHNHRYANISTRLGHFGYYTDNYMLELRDI